MDFVFPELLRREDIIQILCQRHLKRDYLETLSTEDLKQIYKSFALPRAKREIIQKRTFYCPCIAQPVELEDERAAFLAPNPRKRQQSDDVFIDDYEMKEEDADLLVKRCKYNGENSVAHNCEKRERDYREDYNYLNAITKRIKIN